VRHVLITGLPGSGKTTTAGPLVVLDTTVPVDIAEVASRLRPTLTTDVDAPN
jgi:broad-specificity NMP kinase